MTGRLLTTREVAAKLGLSPASVLRRWQAGELPGFRLASNVLRFDENELDAWLAERHRGPQATIPPSPVRSVGEARAAGYHRKETPTAQTERG